jgi:Synergist-CTERM protein sorting domain-containing protein
MKALKTVSLSSALITDIPDNFVKDSKEFNAFTLPTQTKAIGSGAFAGTKLTIFAVGANVKTIGAGAFEKCEALTTVTLAAGSPKLEAIEANAFSGAKALTAFPFASATKLKTIGAGAFKGCVALTALSFIANDELTTIGDNAFSGCKGITGTVTFPGANGKLASIGAGAFEGCAKITGATFTGLETLAVIGDNAFKGAKDLATLNDAFDDSVLTELGSNIFEGTKVGSTQTITANFGDTLAKIGARAFGKAKVDVVFRYDTTEPELASVKELADFLAGLDIKDMFKGVDVATISIADVNYPTGVPLDDLGLVPNNDPTDPNTVSIVTSLYNAGLTAYKIVELFNVGSATPGSAIDPTYPLTLDLVDKIAKGIQDNPSGGPSDPGAPGGPSDPGTPPAGGGDDEDDLPASGSSGCDVTGFAPLAALLALGVARVRKARG